MAQNEPTFHEIHTRLIGALSMSVIRVLSKNGCWLPIGRHYCIGAPESTLWNNGQRDLEFDDEDVQEKVRSSKF